MFLEIILIAIYVIFAILLIDLFYADKEIEFLHLKKKNLTEKMELGEEIEWITKGSFWKNNFKYEILCYLLGLIPIVNIISYIYYLSRLRNSNYEFSSNHKDIDIMFKRNSLNSYILPWI